MEIERKFLLTKMPDMPCISSHHVTQGYLSIEPEVRIRSKEPSEPLSNTFTLCIKGEGYLSREEVEVDISEEHFNTLRNMVQGQMITKQYQKYRLPDNLVAECSVVDSGTEHSFAYVEVEFESEEDAISFVPPEYFGREITYCEEYKMKRYWERTRRNG